VVKQGKPWKTLDDLPPGSVVGTSSVRRVAQLKRKYPDLKFMDVVSTGDYPVNGIPGNTNNSFASARKSVCSMTSKFLTIL
jgi:hypothetical protein